MYLPSLREEAFELLHGPTTVVHGCSRLFERCMPWFPRGRLAGTWRRMLCSMDTAGLFIRTRIAVRGCARICCGAQRGPRGGEHAVDVIVRVGEHVSCAGLCRADKCCLWHSTTLMGCMV